MQFVSLTFEYSGLKLFAVNRLNLYLLNARLYRIIAASLER